MAKVGAPKIEGSRDIRQANGPLFAFPREWAPAFSYPSGRLMLSGRFERAGRLPEPKEPP